MEESLVLSKNNSIHFFRVLFTYLIAAFHFNNPYPFISDIGMKAGWYYSVEFFFMVSGFLLYDAVKNNKFNSLFLYEKDRIKKIYPGYIISFIIVFFLMLYKKRNETELLKLLVPALPEVFCLQALKLNRGWTDINPTLWYISVLFIDSALLFIILNKNERLYLRFISPLLIIFSYAIIFIRFGHLDTVVETDGIINYAILRGLSDMTLGMYSYILFDKLRRIKNEKKKDLLKRTGFILMMIIFIITLFKGRSAADFILLIPLVFGVSLSFLETKNKILLSKGVFYLSRLSLYIYLFHEIFRTYLFPFFFRGAYKTGEKIMLLILYLLTITAFSALFEKCMTMVFRSRSVSFRKKD